MVLIVEDEIDLARTCERLLRRQGYAVVTTSTRASALRMLETGVSCLVVCDVGLPDGSGLDVVRAAKQRTPPVPAIVMTARPSAAGRRAALESGADEYMTKPFTASGFAALVGRTVARP
jgi:DNA-binding response OmpR family regulator